MKAVGYLSTGPIEKPNSLIDFHADTPRTEGRDILVKIRAISVNPVDTKIRTRRQPSGGVPAILGWDAAGEIVELGEGVRNFKLGDMVWYAGAIDRPGTNAEFHLVDERIVSRTPKTLSAREAAAMPLTTLTAYEMLFDRLRVNDPVPGAAPAILIIGGAGGVGSIAIQLARALTDLTVIATASRPETKVWCKKMGAHHVIDHSQPLTDQVIALRLGEPAFVFSTTHSDSYFEPVAEIIAPQGRFGLIDDPASFNIAPFKQKSVSTHWEFMYTRSLFKTEDMQRQGDILAEVAQLFDQGRLHSTATETLGVINGANLKRAHAILESGKAHGKLVLDGFG